MLPSVSREIQTKQIHDFFPIVDHTHVLSQRVVACSRKKLVSGQSYNLLLATHPRLINDRLIDHDITCLIVFNEEHHIRQPIKHLLQQWQVFVDAT
ncbi:hypothetical protein D3C73_1409730 [compost metagenome]